jgi:enoyl-CoA hydratase/carnithine racemase
MGGKWRNSRRALVGDPAAHQLQFNPRQQHLIPGPHDILPQLDRRGADHEVVLVTLNRPEKLNAWTPTMADEQAHAIEAANDDPTVGAIVMTGAGRGFCAGADMEATFKSRLDGVDPGRDTAGGTGGMPRGLDWVALLRESKPIVCAINGAAVGIGVTMCLPADQLVASTGAKFGMGFIKMGLVPELASTRLLAARVGLGRASDLMLSGRIVPAADAHRIGLVDDLVEPDELLDRAIATAASSPWGSTSRRRSRTSRPALSVVGAGQLKSRVAKAYALRLPSRVTSSNPRP